MRRELLSLALLLLTALVVLLAAVYGAADSRAAAVTVDPITYGTGARCPTPPPDALGFTCGVTR